MKFLKSVLWVAAMITVMSLPALANKWDEDWVRRDWDCCLLVPSANTNDPELIKLWGQITAGFSDADRQISLELTKEQRQAFSTTVDDANIQWFKVHCLTKLEAHAYAVYLSERLHLSDDQFEAVVHIEHHMANSVHMAWMAYCDRYWMWLHERYATAPIPPFPEAAPPPGLPEYHPPAPSRKIPRNKDIK